MFKILVVKLFFVDIHMKQIITKNMFDSVILLRGIAIEKVWKVLTGHIVFHFFRKGTILLSYSQLKI